MKFNYYKLLFCFLLQKNRRSFCKRLISKEIFFTCRYYQPKEDKPAPSVLAGFLKYTGNFLIFYIAGSPWWRWFNILFDRICLILFLASCSGGIGLFSICLPRVNG